MVRSTPAICYPQTPNTMSIQIYFDRPISHSPEHSDSDSDSDTTLEDIDSYPQWNFGHPLQRMIRLGNLERDDGSNLYSSFSSCSSDSGSSTTSSIVYDIDYEALVDDLLTEKSFLLSDPRNLVMVEPSSKDSEDSVMIKCLPRTSPELFILLELNHHELRLDPWNPVPHILCAVERGDQVYLCMERLIEFNQPPFKTVANYIDFFKQTLEGLTFLHEHHIAHLSCLDPKSFMVDIGSGTSSVAHFDRTIYPVRYYFTNLSRAAKFDSLFVSDPASPFKRDVQECGMMMDRLLVNIPRVGPKLKSLVKAMTSGGFGADDSRKLFEALCKSLESSVFDIPVSSPNNTCP